MKSPAQELAQRSITDPLVPVKRALLKPGTRSPGRAQKRQRGQNPRDLAGLQLPRSSHTPSSSTFHLQNHQTDV